MKFLLVASLAVLALVSVAASAEVEWIQPSFIEAALPTPGQKCGAGGVCSAKAIWCGKKTPVLHQCAGTAVCCTPKPVAVAPKPAPQPAPAPAHITPAPAAPSSVNNLPVGDLSSTEALVDGEQSDTPLDNAASAALAKADAAAKAVPNPNVPPLTYDFTDMFNDDVLTVNGQVVHSGPKVGAGPAATRKGVIPAVGAVPNGSCGAYSSSSVTKIAGNGGVVYEVVKILPQHAVDPSSLRLSPSASDNTMRTATACAFDKMHNAALKAGINIKISSAFRTIARQNYFWNCHVTKKCNKGRLAAHPGTSNHGRGIALDLNQASPGVYNWLAKNAQSFGFVRTVPSERWHWEYRPGTPKARYT